MSTVWVAMSTEHDDDGYTNVELIAIGATPEITCDAVDEYAKDCKKDGREDWSTYTRHSEPGSMFYSRRLNRWETVEVYETNSITELATKPPAATALPVDEKALNPQPISNKESFELGMKGYEIYRTFFPGSKYWNELDWHERAAWSSAIAGMVQIEREARHE